MPVRERKKIQKMLRQINARHQPPAIRHKPILIPASAFFLILSFPNFNLWFLAWIGFVPLLCAIDGKKPIEAFALSYLTGVLFFLGTVYWLVHVTLPGMIAVVLYLALYFGIFGLVVSSAAGRKSPVALLVIPAVWVALEWVRAHLFTGFGWALLAHSQSYNLPIIQIADMAGAYGVSFLVMAVNAAIFMTIRQIRNKNYYTYYMAAALFLVFLSLAYGVFRLKNIFAGDMLKVAVVQGNIPQTKKWDRNYRAEIVGKYAALTLEASKEKPDLIIWPETSVPGFLESERDLFGKVAGISKSVGVPLLVGTPSIARGEKDSLYNSAVLFGDGGRVLERYDKLHLVPFGEYVPLKELFSFVEKFAPMPIGDFSRGTAYTVFKFFIERDSRSKDANWHMLKKVRFSCLICFEDIFPELASEFVRKDALFLVNITNDAWFGNTSAPYQHAQSSVFRAVENRVNVVRAANTGLSCFIDQKGMITAKVCRAGKDLFVDGVAAHDIVLTKTRTFYTVYGDIFAYCCMVIALAYVVGIIVKRGVS